MLARRLFRDHIRGTAPRAIVALDHGSICNIKRSVMAELQKQIGGIPNRSVTLGTVALKHIHDRHVYDKGVPVDFMCLLDHFGTILKYPDAVYLNDPTKRGHFLFVRVIDGVTYLCGVEKASLGLEVVTAFVTGPAYLRQFTQLWGREDG